MMDTSYIKFSQDLIPIFRLNCLLLNAKKSIFNFCWKSVMNFLRIPFLFCICLLLQSCGSSSSQERLARDYKRSEELNQKELRLKEAELQLQRKEDSLRANIGSQSLSQYFEQNKAAVWRIYTLSNEGISQGSAFVIDQDGTAVSNYHVFADAQQYYAVNAEGEKYSISGFYNSNESLDYVVFKIQSKGNPFPFVKIASSSPNVGEDCFAIGNPYGLVLTISKGIISGMRQDDKYIQTTAEITHGSSGGPLFNSRGEVIGITTMGAQDADLNFAVNIQNVSLSHEFVNASNYEGGTDTARMEVETSNQHSATVSMEDARSSVVNYFEYQSKHQYAAMGTYLAPFMHQFYLKENITKEEAISESRDYDTQKGITVRSYHIYWSTAEMKELSDGFFFKFIMDYSISSTSPNLPTNMKLEMTVGVTRGLNINFIKQKML